LQILGALPLFAAACGKSGPPESCSDVAGLNEAEKSARSALQYSDNSPHADKHCNGCNLFQPPPEVSQCGSCQIVKGPIHPNGYCTAWVQKT
jgi:hypothetical protein